MRERTAILIDTFASLSSLEDFSLSPNGQAVAFTREAGAHTQVFVKSLERAEWSRRVTATLTDCLEPKWSPDSKQLAYVRGKALWIANADGTHARELVDHPAGNSSAAWSPDGSCIAFVSRRRGWDHVWTVTRDGGELAQVTRGAFDAADPVWSPDSNWLAFSSVPPDDLMTRSVYIIPASGGEAVPISPRGSWSGAPSFSPDGRTLAYLSDQDGWFHVYLYDLSLHTARQLTRGECEDGGPHFYNIDPRGGPHFSPDGKTIAFIRHREGKFDLWVAEVTTGAERRVSEGDGEYGIIGWMPDSERIAVTFDNPATICDLWLLSTGGERVQVTDSSVAELHSPEMILPEWISYTARDGLAISAALFRPAPSDQAARSPAVLFLHGGPNFEFGQSYYPLPQILAQEGYVVLAPNYRGSTGHGTAFRQANIREWGHADALDIVDGALWLQQQDFVDCDRLAVVGPSYGGYLTLCTLTLAPELFCAGVDMYGDSELGDSYRHGDRDARLDLKRHMGTPEDNPEGYRRGSPVYLAERIQAPLLILHGKEDMLVVPLMSEKLIEALKIEGKYYEAYFYEGEEHGFAKPENKKDVWERICRFLNRHCRGELGKTR